MGRPAYEMGLSTNDERTYRVLGCIRIWSQKLVPDKSRCAIDLPDGIQTRAALRLGGVEPWNLRVRCALPVFVIPPRRVFTPHVALRYASPDHSATYGIYNRDGHFIMTN
jgi:hypothetical protein